MKTFILTITAVSTLFLTNVYPQSEIKETPFSQLKSEIQKEYHTKQIQGKKGGKFKMRFIEKLENELGPYGELPNKDLMNEAAKAAITQIQNSNKAGSDWMPMGPNGVPTATGFGVFIDVGRVNVIEFHPTDQNTFWIGTPNAGIWKTTNNGQSWQQLPLNSIFPSVSAIIVDPDDPDVIYVGTGDYDAANALLFQNGLSAGDDEAIGYVLGAGIFKSSNGGDTWTQLDNNNSLIRAMEFSASGTLYAAGVSGIESSTDGGNTWELEFEGVMLDFYKDPSFDYYIGSYFDPAAGTAKLVQRPSGDWLEIPGVLSNNIVRTKIAISESDPDIAYMASVNNAGALDKIYKGVWTNAGFEWTVVLDGTDKNVLDFYYGTAPDGQGSYDLTLSIDPQDEDKVYVGGVNLWGSENGGDDWEIASFWLKTFENGMHGDQHDMQYNPLNGRYYFCNDGGVYYTDDLKLGSTQTMINCNGASDCYSLPTNFRNISDGLSITEFYTVSTSANTPQYIIGGAQDNSTYFYEGNQWLSLFSGDGADCGIHPDEPNRLVAGSQEGVIYNLDLLNPSAASVIRPQELGEVGSWVTPYAFNWDFNGMYFGYGEIWGTELSNNERESLTDFGDDPDRVPPHHELALSNDKTQLIAIKRPGAEFAKIRIVDAFDGSYDDISAGLPIDLAPYPSRATFGNTNDDLFIAFSGYIADHKVYRSQDGGNTWFNYSEGLPGIPIQSIAHHYGSVENMVYVGTNFGVFYRTDNMSSWESYSDNLPSIIVRDLDINYTSQKLTAATFGRGIWQVDLLPTGLTSTEDVPLYNSNFTISSNPSRGQFDLIGTDYQGGDKSLKFTIVNNLGEQVHTSRVENVQQEFRIPFDLDLLPGMYYLSIEQDKFTRVEKVQIIR